MGANNTDNPVENGHRRIVKERKLTSYDNGRSRRPVIIRGGGIRSTVVGMEVRAISGQEGSRREDESYNMDL